MILMAKKSSSNAIKKIDSQLKKLNEKNNKKDEEKTPVPISLNVSRYVSDFKEYLRTLNRIKIF